MSMDKKALSPLIATSILIIFSLIVGTVTMNLGKNYVDTIDVDETETTEEVKTGTISINYADIDSDLKNLQIKHLIGEITEEEYLEEQKLLQS